MMRKIFYIIVVILTVVVPIATTTPPSAFAAEFTIAAIVNDRVITNHMLNQRISLVIKSSGLRDIDEVRKKIRPQILEMLVDEALQGQKAEEFGWKVSENELARAISSIEKKNNQPPGSFIKFLQANNLSEEAFIKKIKAQLLWEKILLRRIRSKVYVSNEEIIDFMTRARQTKEGERVLISEIILPVERPEQEEDVRALARKLSEELEQGGNFAAIAKQFSRSSTAKEGGRIGWLSTSDLDPMLRKVLETLEKGNISSPIRTNRGYYIIKLEDVQSTGEVETTGPNEEQAKAFLTSQKMDLEARKFIKELRETAYIERRLN